MLNASPNAEPATPSPEKPRGSAWAVYRRLLGYTWQYKVRLLVSLLFAVFIAVSFTTMLIAVREVVNLTYYEPGETAAVETGDGARRHEDPKERIARAIESARQRVNAATAWLPGDFLALPDFRPRFNDLVASMRAERFAVMKVTCILLVIFSLAVGIARFLQEFFAGTISANISTEMARNMYDNLMAQSVGFFETSSTGNVLARFTNDIFMVNRGLEGVLVKVMREPVKAVCFLSYALYTDPVLTLIGVCGLPPVFIILTKIGMKMRKSVRRSLEKISTMASVVHETVNGIAIVKVFTMEGYEINRVRSEIERLRKFLYQMVRLHATTGPVTEFILVIGVAIFLLVAGQRMDTGELNYGQMLTLLLALAMMLDPVRKLSAVNNMVQTSIASAERIFEYIDMKPAIDERGATAELPPMEEGIRFNNVTFGYQPDTPVLRNLTLEVKKGMTVALVGSSGSGKSTIIKLLPRFYDVQEGSITIDGVDIRDVSAQSLRDQMSLVTQDTILFAETVRENIAAGRADYTDAQIKQAAHAANAAAFIEKLPQGYDTRLDESGTTLSGGQRQRLAIARAFIKDPTILILDEATSSLDTESERLIQDALDHFLDGRTAFVIAHRLSTVQHADTILVIDNGRIMEEGDHATLLENDGIYSRLYRTQFGVEEVEDGENAE